MRRKAPRSPPVASVRAGGGVVSLYAGILRSVRRSCGGARACGYGREGVTFAMEEMTESRLVVVPAGL
jgi:hypothetical protein